MDDLSKAYVISFFNKNLQLFGDRPEAVRWSPRGQQRRYASLLDIGRIDNAEILDYGCGKGDFYQFLKDHGIAVRYTGCDINEKLISVASEKYPDARFVVFDAEQDMLNQDFDYMFLCGVFNLKVMGLDEVIRNSLLRLFPHCRKGLAFNALSALNPDKNFELHYTSPDALFTFAVQSLSPYVVLRHDRLDYDFTMFVYKEPVHAD